jgi:parvulin-like peptidyl-prolyl isomerase
VKWFLVLLLFLAGGLAAASLSVPSNAAVVNGQGISQDQLTSDVTAIAKSPEYQCYLNADEELTTQGQQQLPPVDGAGSQASTGAHTTASTAFTASYLGQTINQAVVLQVAAAHHIALTAKEEAAALTGLKSQISSVLSEASSNNISCGATTGKEVLDTMPHAFVSELARYEAALTAVADQLGGLGTSTEAQGRFFQAHRAEFDQACFTVANYASASDAESGRAAVYEGESFASVAAKTSGGGPQGCDVLYGVTSQLPATANLENLPVNTVSAPIAVSGEYVLIEITARNLIPFSAAQANVQQAMRTVDDTRAQTALTAAERRAKITVNPAYGGWRAGVGMVLPVLPASSDVCNASANTPGATAASSTTSSVSLCTK